MGLACVWEYPRPMVGRARPMGLACVWEYPRPIVGQARPEYPGSVESQAPSMGGPGALMNGQLPGFVPARTPEPGAMVL